MLDAVNELAANPRPAAPGSGAADADIAAWLAKVTEYMKEITTLAIPIMPTFSLPAGSEYANAFAPGAAPAGGDAAAAMVWLRRAARVRTGAAALHDVLLASEILQSNNTALTLAQLPASPGDQGSFRDQGTSGVLDGSSSSTYADTRPPRQPFSRPPEVP